MKIAHVATSISINQVVLGGMICQRDQGHEVTALCPDDEWAVAIHDAGFRVIDVPWLRHDVGVTPRAALRTWQVCRRERFDIVNTTNALPGLFGRPAARLAG
ncbi:MAG: glycosyltransferase, partial [Gemmatimonadota bacterium]